MPGMLCIGQCCSPCDSAFGRASAPEWLRPHVRNVVGRAFSLCWGSVSAQSGNALGDVSAHMLVPRVQTRNALGNVAAHTSNALGKVPAHIWGCAR